MAGRSEGARAAGCESARIGSRIVLRRGAVPRWRRIFSRLSSASEEVLTEVPEHLLKRSRDRRAALGLGGDDGGEAAPAASSTDVEPAAASAPAAAAAVPAVEAPPPPPEPVAPHIEAAESRKRVPVWAMPVLAFLPIWAVIYAQALSPPPVTTLSQVDLGAQVFANQGCSGCHGASGGGGAGRQLSDGEVVKTFPNIANQLEFVNLGSAGYEGQVYGNPNRPGGTHAGLSFGRMPTFNGKLTDAELLEVVRHERETLGGESKDNIKVDAAGNRLWPNGKPMLDATSGKLVWDDGTPMFDDKGHLTKQVDASQPAAGG